MCQAKWGAGVSLGSCFRNAKAQFARPSRQRLKITSADLLDFFLLIRLFEVAEQFEIVIDPITKWLIYLILTRGDQQRDRLG